ncbi:MAG: STAS domain-containing protein [Solirubrobacteraceae bacterium]
MIDEFEAEIEVRGPDLWVLPHGDLDIDGAPELQEAMRLALASDATSIVVDLRGIELLDSTGLRALLEARVEEGGERVTYVQGNERVQGVLRIAGLLDALPFREP